MVTMAPAEAPVWKLAPFRKTTFDGPGARTFRLNVTEKPLELAVMTTAPGVGPAETVVEAWPFVAVVAVGVPTVALPLVTANVTPWPATGLPFVSFTATTSGLANPVFSLVVWVLPETIE